MVIMPTWMEAMRDSVYTNPVGSHNARLDISSVGTLTPPAGARNLLIQAITQNARYTLDGTAPDGSTGFQIKAGNAPRAIHITNGVTVKVIEETATCELQYQWLE